MNTDCTHKGCQKVGIYEFEGKKYCPQHYGIALIEASEKRVKRLQNKE